MTTNGNLRDLTLLIESLDEKLRAEGYADNSNPETRAALIAELADQSTAFEVLDDYEARLGLDVADERASLVDLFVNANNDARVLALA